jgi:hypothetical protein
MKRFALIILAAFLALAAGDNPRLAYIEKYSKLAVSEMKRTGVPASITLAQGLLESNAGQSKLAVKGNNHFGIKCHNDWDGKKMKVDDNVPGECFRVYASADASFRDHSDFLRGRDRYKSLFDLKTTDYKGWAKGLKKAGYATDPNYADKLITIIEDYRLYEYDSATKVSVKPPLEVEAPKVVVPEVLDRKYRESVHFSLSRTVYEQNGTPFVYSIEGESYSSIAAANGLFLRELLRYNDLGEETALAPGSKVYLARKQAQAAEGVMKYVVEGDGETMWNISQRFGIRLAALQKMNPALIGYRLEEGDTIRLRKK